MDAWITQTLANHGYWGVALRIILEIVFPPIPSEVVLPAAGFAASRGELSLWGVIVSCTFGSLFGVTPWYVLAQMVDQERLMSWADRYGNWLAVNCADVSQAMDWF